MRRLTDGLREIVGRAEVPILIDQEGGRVARMRPPEWPAFPTGEAFDRLYQLAPSSAIEAARVNARALALMLNEVGVNVDCLPMLDVRQPGATDIVGDRALGSEPMQVAALGRAMLDGLAFGRRARRDQAYSGPRPGAGRQPSRAAGRRRRRGGARDRPRAVRAASRRGDGDDQPPALHSSGTRTGPRRSRRSSSTTSSASGSASTAS